jgi:osmotically-inducible protein OsmY
MEGLLERYQITEQLGGNMSVAIRRAPEADSQIAVSVKNGSVTLIDPEGSAFDGVTRKYTPKPLSDVVLGANTTVMQPSFLPTDVEIARDIVQALKRQTFSPDEWVRIIVNDGFLTLEGSVEWNSQRRNVESAVRPVAGVRGIIENIQVKQGTGPAMDNERISRRLFREATPTPRMPISDPEEYRSQGSIATEKPRVFGFHSGPNQNDNRTSLNPIAQAV